MVIENTAGEILAVVKEVEALANDLRQGPSSTDREPALIEKWRVSLEFEHFDGDARPSLDYLRANEHEFLDNGGIGEATIKVSEADQPKSAAA